MLGQHKRDLTIVPYQSGWIARFEEEADLLRAALGQKARGKMEIGIRPMYLKAHADAVENGIPAAVKSVEDQGSFKILTVNMAGHILRARLPEGQPVPSDEAWLRFPKQRTKLFADERLVSA